MLPAWEELREVSLSTHHFSGTGFSLKDLGGVPWRAQKTQ